MPIFERSQWIPRSIDEVWTFVADTSNLKEISPSSKFLEILTQNLDSMHEGQQIEYKIQMLPLIRRRWVMEIADYSYHHFFVEEQLSGPFRFWHHRHQFDAKDNGVWMIDKVSFQFRFGNLGKLAFKAFVYKRLEDQFDYRASYMEEKFGASPARKSGSF